jgi:hypothetical protein
MKKYEELFKVLISNHIKFMQLSASISDVNKNITFIDMHGSFEYDSGFQTVPDNVVLIFLTPVNRFVLSACSSDNYEYVTDLISIFKDTETRQNIFKYISCLDKKNIKNNKDSVSFIKFAMQEAIVLFPNQKYFDLKLTKSSIDTNKNIYNFNGNTVVQIESELESNPIEQISIILSEYLNTKYRTPKYKEKLNYVFIKCCRSIDYDIGVLSSINNNNTKKLVNKIIDDGNQIYTYEIFMYYFNTIINNCELVNLGIKKFTQKITNTEFSNLFKKLPIAIPKLSDIIKHASSSIDKTVNEFIFIFNTYSRLNGMIRV